MTALSVQGSGNRGPNLKGKDNTENDLFSHIIRSEHQMYERNGGIVMTVE